MSEPGEAKENLLLDRLASLTRNGTIRWSPTATTERSKPRQAPGEPFMVNFTESTLRISSDNGDGEPPYSLRIYNGEGRVGLRIYAETPQQEARLQEIYQLARRNVLQGYEEIMDIVINELSEEEKKRQSNPPT